MPAAADVPSSTFLQWEFARGKSHQLTGPQTKPRNTASTSALSDALLLIPLLHTIVLCIKQFKTEEFKLKAFTGRPSLFSWGSREGAGVKTHIYLTQSLSEV